MVRALEDKVLPFDFTLERKAEVPIGVQLTWAIRARIEDGRFVFGQRLPGSRDVAETLSVNANTVRAVYNRLELDGLIESRHGTGTFVASSLPERPRASMIAAAAAAEARQAGVEPRDVAAALYVDNREPPPSADDGETERRRVLRSQIVTLQQTIDEIEVEHVGLIDVPAERSSSAARGPRLPDSGELEQVRLQLVRRLVALQAAIDELASEPPPAVSRARQRPEPKPKAAKASTGSDAKGASSRRRPPRPASRAAAAGA